MKKIKLIERETLENAPMWQEKQMLAFSSALPLTPTPSLGQAITEEMNKNAYDEDILNQRSEEKLKQIADSPMLSIIDRLEPDNMNYLVIFWGKK